MTDVSVIVIQSSKLHWHTVRIKISYNLWQFSHYSYVTWAACHLKSQETRLFSTACQCQLQRLNKAPINWLTERHTAHNIVSLPNPKQWVIVHTSDLMMIISQSIYILSIITREMGKLKTQSHTYFIMDNWDNMPYLTHTLDKLYLTSIL